MQCPFCGKDDSKVVDSRSAEGGKVVRRRRQCLPCGRRFTTYERAEEGIRLNVVKKDGSREPYDRQKLIVGLQKACYKRKVSDEQVRQIVEATEEEIFRDFDRDVPSDFIGDTVSRRLKEIDPVAYIRFASVYENYADLEELMARAREVEEPPPPSEQQKTLFDSQQE